MRIPWILPLRTLNFLCSYPCSVYNREMIVHGTPVATKGLVWRFSLGRRQTEANLKPLLIRCSRCFRRVPGFETGNLFVPSVEERKHSKVQSTTADALRWRAAREESRSASSAQDALRWGPARGRGVDSCTRVPLSLWVFLNVHDVQQGTPHIRACSPTYGHGGRGTPYKETRGDSKQTRGDSKETRKTAPQAKRCVWAL